MDIVRPGFNAEAFKLAMLDFQLQWAAWMSATYPQEQIDNTNEASRLFAEEAIECMQAMGMTKEQVLFMVDYVFGREKGDPAQEAAGAVSCLVTLCNQRNIDLGKAAVADLDFCWTNLEKVRAKNKQKPRPEEPEK